MFVSTLSGASPSWSAVGSGLPTTRVQALEVSANGTTLYAGFNGSGSYRTSLTGSPNWESINIGLDNSIVNDLLTANGKLYAATDGGVFVLDSATSIWSGLNDCLPFIKITSLATSGSSTKLFAATDDGRVFIRPL